MTHRKVVLHVVAFSALALWSSAPTSLAAYQAPAGEAEAVVARAVRAFGGEDAIRGVASYRLEGLIVTPGGDHGRVYRIADCPSDLAVLIDYTSRREIRVVADGEAWRGADPERLTAVSGPLYDAMVLQAARSCLPMLMLEKAMTAELVERRDEMAIVSFDLGPGLTIRVFVSESDGRVLRSEATMESAMGAIEFAADYDDYREVEGLLVPFREETFASGTHTASIRIDVLEPNPVGERAKLPTSRER